MTSVPLKPGRPRDAIDFEVTKDWDRVTIAGRRLQPLPKGRYYIDPATEIVTQVVELSANDPAVVKARRKYRRERQGQPEIVTGPEVAHCQPDLRWRNGVLQQLWRMVATVTHCGLPVSEVVREEWRDVPKEEGVQC